MPYAAWGAAGCRALLWIARAYLLKFRGLAAGATNPWLVSVLNAAPALRQSVAAPGLSGPHTP